MSNLWIRLKKPANPVSWKMVGLLFLGMLLSYLGFTALSPGLRVQMRSAHSFYWTFTFPWSVGCMALFSTAMRLIGKGNAFISGRSTTGDSKNQTPI